MLLALFIIVARYHVNQFSEYPYHITGRVLNRDHFHVALDSVWQILSQQLWLAHRLDGLKIHSFVLMPNHFHLLASVIGGPIAVPMARIMRESSRQMNVASGRTDHTWGGRHYKCELLNTMHFLNTYKYIYQNPVRAGLSRSVEDWPFSTLHALLGNSHTIVPIEEDTQLFAPASFDWRSLEWLNTPIAQKDLEHLRHGLRKRIFSLKKKWQHTNDLETRLV